ncbi:hypothetical protein PR202_gb15710 [Eleusine coracana subsp. coracana]|uniref:Uncharacterized protein n=1 Tax=Eleusine coracana subsp. coracana TaxID=191504 RepID=A0AAV5EZ00_ELECO|nr:hypothetical protein PR202_gb15710 [Eleusine coracana subsp. coracana]
MEPQAQSVNSGGDEDSGGILSSCRERLCSARDRLRCFAQRLATIARDDPRRVAHALKVGVALNLVSMVYYISPIFNSFGDSAMWALLTVVVVMEFTVGGTLSKGLNRAFATLVAGLLAIGAHLVADFCGGKGEPILLGIFVFVERYNRSWEKEGSDGDKVGVVGEAIDVVDGVSEDEDVIGGVGLEVGCEEVGEREGGDAVHGLVEMELKVVVARKEGGGGGGKGGVGEDEASAATFSRFIPEIKARYDYGVTIFILTFSLVAVSSYRVNELIQLAHQRGSTVGIGVVTCLFTSIFIFPIWAGDDLHSLTADNLDKLAEFLAGMESECFGENASSDLEGKSFLLVYKSVLNSKAREDSLCREANSELCFKVHTACRKMSSHSAKVLTELAKAIRTMTVPSPTKNNDMSAAMDAANYFTSNLLEDTALLESRPHGSLGIMGRRIRKGDAPSNIDETTMACGGVGPFRSFGIGVVV